MSYSFSSFQRPSPSRALDPQEVTWPPSLISSRSSHSLVPAVHYSALTRKKKQLHKDSISNWDTDSLPPTPNMTVTNGTSGDRRRTKEISCVHQNTRTNLRDLFVIKNVKECNIIGWQCRVQIVFLKVRVLKVVLCKHTLTFTTIYGK